MIRVCPADCTDFSTGGSGTPAPLSAEVTETRKGILRLCSGPASSVAPALLFQAYSTARRFRHHVFSEPSLYFSPPCAPARNSACFLFFIVFFAGNTIFYGIRLYIGKNSLLQYLHKESRISTTTEQVIKVKRNQFHLKRFLLSLFFDCKKELSFISSLSLRKGR